MALENKDNILQVFQTRARQLMYEYESVRKQRNELVKTVEQKELEIKKLHEKLENLEQSYQNLKTAKMIEINNGDVAKSKQRFEALVRQVDKCIALLNVKNIDNETMNEVSEKFVIQLRIDNQTYPIKIRRDEEEIYRAAERKINDKLNLYKEHFPNLEEERYMFMAMLDLSVQLIRSEKRNDTEPYEAVLQNITAEIESTLASE